MDYPDRKLLTITQIDEGDINGFSVYEIELTSGEVIYVDPTLSETNLQFDMRFPKQLVSVFAYNDLTGINQIYINLAHIVRVTPMEIGG